MGVGPFSSSSDQRSETLGIESSQTVADQGVAIRQGRTGNIRLGKNATLIQYFIQPQRNNGLPPEIQDRTTAQINAGGLEAIRNALGKLRPTDWVFVAIGIAALVAAVAWKGKT